MTRARAILALFPRRTDEAAMVRVKTHNDHQEFALLVRKWEEPIRRLCARMIGDSHRAEDLTQETFLRVFEKRKDYQPSGRFSTFLWRVALNLCYDELRRQQRRREFVPAPGLEGVPIEPPEPIAEMAPPDLSAALSEEGQLVRQAVLELPEIYRTVIVLRHYQDLRLAKIAEILDIPEGTVNSRMAEALARLSRRLTPKLKEAPKPLSSPPLAIIAKTSVNL